MRETRPSQTRRDSDAGAPRDESEPRSVADVMTRDVHVLRAEDSLATAEQLLFQHRVHGAPVLDGDGRLVGLVSQTDLLAWRVANCQRAGQPGDPERVAVSAVMTAAAHAIRPETSAAAAGALMVRLGVHRLLVVDENLHLAGILSAIDLVRLVPGVSGRLTRPVPPHVPDEQPDNS